MYTRSSYWNFFVILLYIKKVWYIILENIQKIKWFNMWKNMGRMNVFYIRNSKTIEPLSACWRENLIFLQTAVNRLRNCENVARFENHRFYPSFFRRHPKTGPNSISPKRKASKNLVIYGKALKTQTFAHYVRSQDRSESALAQIDM